MPWIEPYEEGTAAGWQPGFRSFLGILLQLCYSGQTAFKGLGIHKPSVPLVLGLGTWQSAIKIKRQSLSLSLPKAVSLPALRSLNDTSWLGARLERTVESLSVLARGLRHQANLCRCTELD